MRPERTQVQMLQQVSSQRRDTPPPPPSHDRGTGSPSTARCSPSGPQRAKPNVKWLSEFIQRGRRENKNITRELQLQPSNMTSVCFCAPD